MNSQQTRIGSILSAVVLGTTGHQVAVQAHVSPGLPGFTVVGLSDTSCREARDRVRAAILSSGLPWPARRVTVTIAPEPVQASSTHDLAMALAVLHAVGELPADGLDGLGAVGELGLDGAIRNVRGVVPLVEAMAAATVVVPHDARVDAELASGGVIRSVTRLREAVDALRGDAPWPLPPVQPPQAPKAEPSPDLAEVRCSAVARRAIEVAASGGHHLLLVGSPGSGAPLLARCLTDILPPLNAIEALETERVHSAAGVPRATVSLRRPPFRAPHSGSPAVAVIGGAGAAMAPGELSLAHNGVLFLDDVRDFESTVLDAVGQALDQGLVRVSKARRTVELPARLLAVGASRSCACGAQPGAQCAYGDAALTHHVRRFALPFLHWFPVRAALTMPAAGEDASGESTANVAARVAQARSVARRRGVRANAQLLHPQETVVVTAKAQVVLDYHLRSGALNVRASDDARRVARTIADLEGADDVDEEHAREAVALRLGEAFA